MAYRHVPSEPNPVPQRVPVPSPTADQVLVKILAAGVCHSDIGILTAGDALNQAVPKTTFTLGHEGAGKWTLTDASIFFLLNASTVQASSSSSAQQ